MKRLSPEVRLTQSALADFAECPLRFRYRYVEGLRLPPPADEEAARRAELGRAFHLLAHRYLAGVDPAIPEGYGAAAPDGTGELLARWLDRLREAVPLPDPEGRRLLPEHEVVLAAPDLPLAARIDLLALGPGGQVTIYDWKTGRWPLPDRLAPSLQTRVYRLTVALAGHRYGLREPGAIRMVYWHPEAPRDPLVIPYSSAELEEDRAVVGEIAGRVLGTPVEAMQATPGEAACRHCEYRPVCFGLAREEVAEEEAAAELIAALAWDDLPEVLP